MNATAPRMRATVRTSNLREQHWTDKARCAIEYGPKFEKVLEPSEQLAVCARCPVKDECLAFGLENDRAGSQSPGSVLPIYGGLTWAQRDAMRRAHRRAA